MNSISILRSYFFIVFSLCVLLSVSNVYAETSFDSKPHPIYDAVFQDNIQAVRAMLDQGVSVDIRGYNDTTPLLEAEFFCKYEIAKLLIEYGANVNAVKKDGYAPLHYVISDSYHIGERVQIIKFSNLTLKLNLDYV